MKQRSPVMALTQPPQSSNIVICSAGGRVKCTVMYHEKASEITDNIKGILETISTGPVR